MNTEKKYTTALLRAVFPEWDIPKAQRRSGTKGDHHFYECRAKKKGVRLYATDRSKSQALKRLGFAIRNYDEARARRDAKRTATQHDAS
jgi:hypothetical protein